MMIQKAVDQLVRDLDHGGRFDQIMARKLNQMERQLQKRMQREMERLLQQAFGQLFGDFGSDIASLISPVVTGMGAGVGGVADAGALAPLTTASAASTPPASPFTGVEAAVANSVNDALEQAVVGHIRGQMRPGGLLDPARPGGGI